MDNSSLISKAAAVVLPKTVKGGLCGDVGAALISGSGQLFTGTCVASGSNVICAEQTALSAMITSGEYIFQKIVAVWKDEKDNIFVIPPCGNCRQFMREIDEGNLKAEIVLDANKSETLKTLLPYYDWWQKQR